MERAIDASASDPGRQLAIRATREWGKIAFVGEGGTCTFNPSPDIIHGQKTIYGSWVTSLWRMEELVERLVRWNIHPEDLITHEFPLEKAGEAYSLMAGGKCGKVSRCIQRLRIRREPWKKWIRTRFPKGSFIQGRKSQPLALVPSVLTNMVRKPFPRLCTEQ